MEKVHLLRFIANWEEQRGQPYQWQLPSDRQKRSADSPGTADAPGRAGMTVGDLKGVFVKLKAAEIYTDGEVHLLESQVGAYFNSESVSRMGVNATLAADGTGEISIMVPRRLGGELLTPTALNKVQVDQPEADILVLLTIKRDDAQRLSCTISLEGVKP
jgi:hypothetical protein